ncbi:MAG: heavy-metal-associated domain-containing protein [Thermonemataceae bacterium]
MKKIMFIAALIMCIGTLQAQSKKLKEVEIKTSAVCGMCKTSIERDLAFEKGVKSSNLNLENKMLTVIYNPKKTSPEKIRQAVTKVGYDADDLPADEKAYDKLEACCKKENSPH